MNPVRSIRPPPGAPWRPAGCSRRDLLAAAGAATLLATARAAPGGLPSGVDHEAGSPEWERLRGRLFGARPIVTGPASAVQLVVPLRAAYGASVPVKVVSRLSPAQPRRVRRLTLLVDKNPSPVAATLTFSPRLAQADLETRLRVDEYSHLRVVAELDDGSLHLASRYVKVSGGCSAPPNRETPHLIGQTRLRLPEGLGPPGAATPVELSVLHPNDTGFELNQVTVMYIPPHFVRTIRLRLDGEPLLDIDSDFSVSENPTWRFRLQLPRGPDGAPRGLLSAEVEDSKEGRFQGQLDLSTVPAAGGI